MRRPPRKYTLGGIHFTDRIKAVGASDTAFYAVDQYNGRVLKAALSYATEETVPIGM